jgi:predicted ferric reductase
MSPPETIISGGNPGRGATGHPSVTGRARRAVRAPGRRSAHAAATAAAGSVIAVVAMWLSNGGLRTVGGAGGAAITVGRLTGLVAADLLLLQVLLMARIPWLERGYGQDVLAHRHRQVGFVSFWLMTAHVGLVTIGYARQADAGIVDQAWTLLTAYPGMLLAAAALALFVAVVGLSLRAARRRLRYESWHLIHLYAYLGVGLVLPHQIWNGADFTASAGARAYWLAMYGATLAAVVVFRIGVPLGRTLYHRFRVAAVVPEAPGVTSVYLAGRRLDRLPARAGHFFLWRFADGPGWSRAHPFSLSAMPGPDRLRITAKAVGDGSARLAALSPGTRVFVEGPFGAMTAVTRRQRKVLLMAAGIGITVLRALLEDLDYEPGDATLLYRIRRRQEAVFHDELGGLVRARGVRVIYAEGPRRSADSCLPEGISDLPDGDALRRLVPDLAHHDAYLCGPPPWMEAARRALREAGVPAKRIHVERFGW